MEEVKILSSRSQICELSDREIIEIGGGIPAIWLAFAYLGAVATIEWAGDKAWNAGRWAGAN